MTASAFAARLAVVLLVASCGGGSGGGAGVTPQQIDRNRTLIMDCAELTNCGGQFVDHNTFNPFVPGGLSRTGYNFLYEPLFFRNAYDVESGVEPWAGESFRFNDNFTEIEISVREGVRWSDGQPWTAVDFVFTINMLKNHAPELLYSTDMKLWVEGSGCRRQSAHPRSAESA